MSTSKKYIPEVPDAMPVKARSAVLGLLARAKEFPFLISVAHLPTEGVRMAGGGKVAIPSSVDASCA